MYRQDQNELILEIQNDHEKALQKAENELLESQNNLLITAVLGILAIGGLAFWNYRKGVKYKQEQVKKELDHKTRALLSNELHINKKAQLIEDLNEKIKSLQAKASPEMEEEISQLSNQIKIADNSKEDWDSFLTHFEGVHPSFFSRLTQKHEGLTQADMKFAAYLKMNLTTKDLTRMLNVSDRTIQSKRYRLKKKLELDNDVDLIAYILSV